MKVSAHQRSHLSQSRLGKSTITALVLLVLAGVGVYFAGNFLGWTLPGSGKSDGPKIIPHTVERGAFVVEAVERGEIESFDNVEVKSLVRATKGSSIKILNVVDEGSLVKKGELLVELDAASLELELTSQQIVCNTKEAALITSQNAFKSAEISLKEYEKGTFLQEEKLAQSAVFIAEETLRRSKEYLAYSERLSARGYVTPQQLDGDRFSLEKAKTELSAAKAALNVLQEYTKPKQLLTFNSDIKSAKADWESDENSYNLELEKLEDLKREIEKCRILAPQDGQVVYANRASSRSGAEFIVEPGSEVRENQVIIRMPSSNAMQVKAKVNESRVNSIRPGLEATIRIDAFGDRPIKGEVTKVNEYPEPTSWYQSQTKEYATEVRILENIKGVRPGLTAEATIHIERRDDTVLIPIQCVYERGRQTWCFRESSGPESINGWEAVEMAIVANNDKYVTVDEGVSEGDVLALNPKALAELMNLPEVEGPSSSREALGGGRPRGEDGAGGGRPAGAAGGRPSGAGGGRPAGAGGGRPSGAAGGKPSGAGGGRPAGAGGGRPAGAAGGRPAGAGGGKPSGAGGRPKQGASIHRNGFRLQRSEIS